LAYRAVLFDLDGTLLNSIQDLAEAMNCALVANGLPARPDVQEHKCYVGDGVRAYVLRAMPEGKRGDRELIARVTADYRRAYAAGWRNNTRPYDGIPELLDELGRRGLRRAVLSNKPDDTTRATVQAFLGLDRFGVVRGAMEGVPLKPDPAATLAIARQVDVPPERFLYVGDTATDMQTAHAAGMFPVGALWGFRDADELTAAGAERLIEQPAQLLELL
jgi:phosphoglycolate phosphatase